MLQITLQQNEFFHYGAGREVATKSTEQASSRTVASSARLAEASEVRNITRRR